MELKNIRLIVLLVTVSLLALIGVQYFWAYHTYQLSEKAVIVKATEAMHATVAEMNSNLDCFELFSKVHINANEGFYMIRQKCDSVKYLQNENAIDTVSMYFADAKKGLPFDYHDLKFGNAANLEMVLKFKFLLDDSSSVDNSFNKHNEITVKNFREKLSDKTPLPVLYDPLDVDSLINYHLNNATLNDPYHFAYVSRENNNILYADAGCDTNKILESTMRVQLTTDKYFSQPYDLVLYFTNYQALLFSGIRAVLGASFLVICILLISFYIFIRVIFRQRKLAELKNDFINNMTHEFKTPLANISLALETIAEEEFQKMPDKKIFQIIGQEADRLRENVEKILHIARIEKEKLHIEFEKLDTNQVIQKAIASFDTLINTNRLCLRCDFNAEAPFIHADETHLINVICNLVDNSIKYANDHCEIVIGTRNHQDGVLIFVKDNGIGISKESQIKVFDKFYRVPNGAIHNVKGFGLGLTYVKSIVDAHHGHVSVKSHPGVETEFEIYLPFNNGKKQ